MKTRLLLSCMLMGFALIPGIQVKGQSVISPEVGVEEHLDSTLPQDLSFVNEQGQAVKLSAIINKPTIIKAGAVA